MCSAERLAIPSENDAAFYTVLINDGEPCSRWPEQITTPGDWMITHLRDTRPNWPELAETHCTGTRPSGPRAAQETRS